MYGPVTVSRAAGLGRYRIENGHGFVMEWTTAPAAPGMSPAELLCGAVGACLAISVDQLCAREGLDPSGISVAVRVEKAPDLPNRFGRFSVLVDLDGIADPAQRARLIAAAERHCTVANTLEQGVAFVTEEPASAS